MAKKRKPTALSNAERQARFRERRAAEVAALRNASKASPDIASGLRTGDIAGSLQALHREIAARRKANHDARQKAGWNPESVLKREQRDLLNWIEDQLDALVASLRNAQ